MQQFNGFNYSKRGKYWYRTQWKHRTAMHRDVWGFHNGPIPDGCHIHHLDGDPANNDIRNLTCMGASAHASLHGHHHRPVSKIALDAAAEWHRSEAGREWHKQHSAEIWAERVATERVCDHCNTSFTSRDAKGRTRLTFCSNTCKSAHRRKSGVDNEQRECVVCGAKFVVNHYAKTKACSRKCAYWSRSPRPQSGGRAIQFA